MSKPLHLTVDKVKKFEQLAMLNDDEIYILENRIKNMTVTAMGINLNKSEATIHRMIKRIKEKYDFIQSEYPDEFPKRRVSEEELYMDTH
jgi:IS30 family transposase